MKKEGFFVPLVTSEEEKINQDRNSLVYKSNNLIQKTRYDLSIQEQKILLMIMQKIDSYGSELSEINFSIKEFCQQCGIDYKNGKNYINVRNAIKSLADKSFWAPMEIDGKEGEALIRWIENAFISKQDGVVKIKMNEIMSQYLLKLNADGFFTLYAPINVLAMKSKYSFRFYELFKSYSNLNMIRLSLEQLRSMLLLDTNKFKTWKDFNVYVLKKSVDEINALTDLEIKYYPIKEGRRIAHVTFKIRTKDIQESRLVIEKVNAVLDKKSNKRT